MVATRRMTFEEFEKLPDDGHRYELVKGELRQIPAGGLRHGGYGNRVGVRVSTFADAHQLGLVFTSETGFRMFPDQDTVYMPGAAFVSLQELRSIEDPDKIGRIVPVLAVEVVSPTDRWTDVVDKVAEYVAAVVPLVSVVQPKDRIVFVFAPGRPPREFDEDDVLDGEDVLPGFALPVSNIFTLPGLP